MNRQRRIDWLFGVLLRLVGAARFARRAAPMMACLMMTTLGVASNHRQASPGVFADDKAAQRGGTASVSQIAPVEAAPTESPHPVGLEQHNLARFIAATYRLRVDQTLVFVEHAYRVASEMTLDPMLILAVISVESNFDPNAHSPQGAQGLMQVITRIHAEKFAPYGGVSAAFDPLANIRVGAQILRHLIRRAGTMEAALKAYVGAALLEHDFGYGAKVLRERERMVAAAAGLTPPPRLAMMRMVASVNRSQEADAGTRADPEAQAGHPASETETAIAAEPAPQAAADRG